MTMSEDLKKWRKAQREGLIPGKPKVLKPGFGRGPGGPGGGPGGPGRGPGGPRGDRPSFGGR